MRYAEFLKKNGTIGFAAPSFGCAAQPYKGAFDNALKNFTQIGYKCMLGPNCYAAEGIGISSTSKKCGEELTQMYCSPDNDVLISCGGGELMCETLEYVDFDAVKNGRVYDLTYEYFGMSADFNYPQALEELRPMLYPESEDGAEEAKENSDRAAQAARESQASEKTDEETLQEITK